MATKRKVKKAKVRLFVFLPICLLLLGAIFVTIGNYWVKIYAKYQEKSLLENEIVALKEKPILNDAIVSDAKELNLDKYAKIISTGASSVGVVKDYVSEELKEYMNSVDLIISKGMGNYEGLTEMYIETPVYFLLTTKCNVISREIGVPIRSPVILKKYLTD
jgi:uncharacterized protein with ATP-grasp and redox domains